MKRLVTATCVEEATSRFPEEFISNEVGSIDPIGPHLGSGLKLLVGPENVCLDFSSCGLDKNNNSAPTNKNFGLHISTNSSQNGLPSPPITSMEIDAANLIVPDSISHDDKEGSPSLDEVRSMAPPPPVVAMRGRPGGRRGRARSGRGGSGRGVLLPGAFSTSHRFLHFARGNGRKLRAGPPSTNTGGIQLHIDLPILNDLPATHIGEAIEVGVDEEIGGVGGGKPCYLRRECFSVGDFGCG